MDPFPRWWRKIWDIWELRVLVLVSLFIQILLILFGSCRKRTDNKKISIVLWLSYLLADATAILALGVLSNNIGESDCDKNDPKNHLSKQNNSLGSKVRRGELNDNLLAFWSPFLLLHLGGPDTITAFSLEDNELWLRHLLNLIFQVTVACYIFMRSLPKNKLWHATVPMFAAGIIKYGERTWALMSASRDNFRESMVTDPDPGPNYAKFMEEYSSKKTAGLNAQIHWEKEPESQMPSTLNTEEKNKLEPEVIISEAYHFFQIFKRLIVDLILTFHHRNESQSFFLKRKCEDAYKVIETELSFVYEVLYTKTAVVHTLTGCILRFFSVSSIVCALIFFIIVEKNQYLPTDVTISYVLLSGAIALEIWSLTRLVFSDWTLVWIKKQNLERRLKYALELKIYFRHDKRWSNSMAQYNLIHFCLKDQPSCLKKVMKFVHFKEIYDKYTYRDYIEVTDELKEFIFEDLKKKLKDVDDSAAYKNFSTCRGELALLETDSNSVLEESIKVEFDESILLWHIATDLCYNMDEKPVGSNQEKARSEGKKEQSEDVDPNQVKASSEVKKEPEDVDGKQRKTKSEEQKRTGRCWCQPKKVEEEKEPDDVDRNQEKSRAVSNYMLYLLVSRPFMLTAGIGQIRFGDTCAEAKKFFDQKDIQTEKEACEKLLQVDTTVDPKNVKGDRSKSVLFDACKLAKSLRKLPRDKRWELISLVWVEMLYFAANHCRGYYHAQRLSAGGELLTIVWFLMAHLGIVEQYRVEAGHARAKLVVEL